MTSFTPLRLVTTFSQLNEEGDVLLVGEMVKLAECKLELLNRMSHSRPVTHWSRFKFEIISRSCS